MSSTPPHLGGLFDRTIHLAEIFDQAPVAFAVLHGPELRYTFANPRYRQIIGGRAPVGLRLVEMFPDLAGSPIEAVIMRVLTTGEPSSSSATRSSSPRRGSISR